MTDQRRDETIAAALDSFAMLADLPDGWAHRGDGVLALVSGSPIPVLNGVWCAHPDGDPELVAGLLDDVAARGVSPCLQFPDRGAGGLSSFAAARGLVRQPDVPLLRCDTLTPGPEPAGIEIERLAPADAGQHADVAARGFGAPREVFDLLVAPELADRPESAFYAAAVDGSVVGTGQGIVTGGAVGVYDVATVPTARGRGVGAAVTRRVVADGLADGARFAWLQSTPLAVPLYERLGFDLVDTWQVWVTPT